MVTTRKENATKRVAQPLLDAKRKRRTKAEIATDNQHLEEERRKAEEARRAGNERIASIQDKHALKVVKEKIAAKPRPRPRPVQSTSKGPGQSLMTLKAEDATNDSTEADASVSVMTMNTARNGKEVPVRPRKESRKTTHRDAVDALRQVGSESSDAHGLATNLKTANHNGQDDDSKEAFLGCVKDWITDVEKNGKPKRPSQRITSSSNVASSTCISSSLNPTAISATIYSSTASAPKPPPSRSPTPFGASAEDEPSAGLFDDDDDIEHEATHSFIDKLPAVNPQISQKEDEYVDYSQPPFTQVPRRSPTSEPVDIPQEKDEHVDYSQPSFTQVPRWSPTSEPVDTPQKKDEYIDYNQPPFTQVPRQSPASVKAEPVDIFMDLSADLSDVDEIDAPPTTLMGSKRATTVALTNDDDDLISIDAPTAMVTGRKRATTVQAADHIDAPSSKRSRTKSSAAQDGNAVESSLRRVKYNNSHIPQGAMANNKWRGTLIPTYAKWNGMLNTCWGTRSSSEIDVLQLLWSVVYQNKIPATFQIDGAIHAVATQRMVEWRGGFASASIAMIRSLINSNERFNTPEKQSELANFWLEGNRFLFEDATGKTAKDFKGMWKSHFVLQTFAAHMHFIQGAIDIPIEIGLKDNKRSYPKAALALAGVAVKRTFVLLRDKALTFEVIPPTGKGKRKATGNEKWKANISGEMFKKDSWAQETARFMQSVERIPPTVWDEIIKTSLQLAKDASRKAGRGTLSDDEDDDIKAPSDEDDELTDLMTYR